MKLELWMNNGTTLKYDKFTHVRAIHQINPITKKRETVVQVDNELLFSVAGLDFNLEEFKDEEKEVKS